jgi:Holliday junction DNA helicase RuvA
MNWGYVWQRTQNDADSQIKDKVGVAAAWKDSATPSSPASPRDAAANDVMLALINLGYKQPEAQKALKRVLDECPGTVPDQGDLLRASLRLLSQS